MLRNKLLNIWSGINAESDQLFSKLESYSQDQLHAKTDADVWSPTEILQHLILSEQLSLAYCKKKLSFEPKLKKANFLTWINGQVINVSLISPFKFKAPKVVSSSELGEQMEFEALKKKWKLQREELKNFLEQVPDKYIDKEVYKHPFGVRLSLAGMLNFYKAHFRRHRKQLLTRLD